MKKLRQQNGETLLETLVSIIIVVLCTGFLVTAIAVAAKTNQNNKRSISSFSYTDATKKSETNVTVQAAGLSFTVPVTVMENNGYTFYEAK